MGERVLARLCQVVLARPGTILLLGVLLSIVGFVLGAVLLEFQGDRDQMIGEDKPFRRRYLEVRDQFGSPQFVVGVVHVDGEIERAARFARRLGTLWRACGAAEGVYEDRERDYFEEHGLYFLELGELEEVRDRIESQADWLKGMAQTRGVVDLFLRMDREFEVGRSGRAADPGPEAIEALREGVLLVGELDRALAGEAVRLPTWAEPVQVAQEEELHLSDGGKLLFVFCVPKAEPNVVDPHARSVRNLREMLEQARGEFPQVRAGLTGRPVLDHDEVQTTSRDMMRAGPIALVGVALLFVLAFENAIVPILAVLTLGVGLGWSFGFTALVVGHLNLVTSVFALILIGLGVDFGIYLVVRYSHERSRGCGLEEAWRITMSETARATCLGALTTSIAFFTTLFIEFRGVQELGLIAGSGVLLCLLSMLTVLPACVVLLERKRGQQVWSRGRVTDFLSRGPSRLTVRRPWWVLGVCFALCAVAIPVVGRIDFSYDHLALQAQELESVRYEHYILDESERSLWFGVSVVEKEALEDRVRAFEALEEVVESVESPRSILPDQIPEKGRVIQSIRGKLPDRIVDSVASRLEDLAPLVSRLARRVEEAEDEAAEAGKAELSDALGRLAEGFLSVVERLGGDREMMEVGLGRFEQDYLGAVRRTLTRLIRMAAADAPTLDNLPDFYREVFVGRDGSCLVQVYPRQDLNHPASMERFLERCQGVDPGFTGEPTQFYHATRLMKEGFEEVTLYAFGAIFLVVFCFFRNLRDCFLTLLPLAVGVIWLLGIMWLGSWRFNLANFFALPVILGIGIDIGIHMVGRFRGGSSVEEIQETAGRAILTTSLTSMIGFGSMMIAQHRGLASLGRLVSLGIATSMVASILVLPSVLAILQRRKGRRNER